MEALPPGEVQSLNEGNLVEPLGIGFTGSGTDDLRQIVFGNNDGQSPTVALARGAINWNRQNQATETVQEDINLFPSLKACNTPGLTFLAGYSDKAFIDLQFERTRKVLTSNGVSTHEELSNADVDRVSQLDADGDGVINLNDNCMAVPNVDQLDANGNGFGDACEL